MPEYLMERFKLFLEFVILDNMRQIGQFFFTGKIAFFSQKLVLSTTS